MKATPPPKLLTLLCLLFWRTRKTRKVFYSWVETLHLRYLLPRLKKSSVLAQILITLPVQNTLPLKHVHHCVSKRPTSFWRDILPSVKLQPACLCPTFTQSLVRRGTTCATVYLFAIKCPFILHISNRQFLNCCFTFSRSTLLHLQPTKALAVWLISLIVVQILSYTHSKISL